MVATAEPAVQMLSGQVRGDLIQAGDPAYDDARKVYNAMHDRRPALIVRPVDTADVIAAVRFAAESDLALSVRGGGHNVAGFGTNDGGMVIDLSRMRSTRIDPAKRVGYIEGGATWGDVDHSAHAFGLATPSGIISTTGVGGLALGGGFGYLTRRWGLTCDNIRSADVVTADGALVKASAQENPDLFWALRGGGGNFGVVTSFEFDFHPVSTVYGGPIFFPVEESENVMRFYREFIANAPRELSVFFGFHLLPPAPFVPEEMHLDPTCMFVACWSGPMEDAEKAMKPLRECAPVKLDLMGPIPYPALNSLFDALLPAGMQHYWKADFARELSDEAIAVHLEHGPKVGNFLSLMHIYPLNGAVQDVAPDATAFAYRDVNFVHNVVGIDTDPAQMPAHKAWVREYWSALQPYSAGGSYVNFLMDEGDDRVKATYRGNYDRLAAVKQRWDPNNLFNQNQNIRPGS